MKKRSGCIIALIIFLMPVIVLSICFLNLIIEVQNPIEDYYYETTDISNYGKYIGNNDNAYPIQFITSFFPEKILDSFNNVVYSYRAEDFDSYGFEAYLEFTIDDKAVFEEYISNVTDPSDWKVFAFDNRYMEYEVSNELDLHLKSQYDGFYLENHHIMSANIGKVLYSSAEQRIIYVAIGVHDGGGVTTDFLSCFFNRFSIDPVEYLDTVSDAG